MKKVSLALTSLYLSLPLAANAATVGGTEVPCSGFTCTPDIATLIESVINWILAITALIAVLMLIIGGILYVTAAGNTDRAKTARQTILYAVIGLIVVVLAYFIVTFVIDIGVMLGS